MGLFQFGEYRDGVAYASVDEHTMRSSATFLMFVGLAAFTSGLMMKYYVLLPYIIGFVMVNFLIGLLFGAKFAPSMLVGRWMNAQGEYLPVGAVQKQFAWSLGLVLSTLSFVVSLWLQSDPGVFELLCGLCILCNTLLYFEVVLGVCVGCKLYFFCLGRGCLKAPKAMPRCTGDACRVE